MNAPIRAELLKLRTTRSAGGFLLVALALAALLGAATAGTAGEDTAAALGTAGNLANVLGVSALPGIGALVLGILAMAGEYQHRTITQTVLTTPARGRVLAAKLVAVALVAAPVAAAMMGVALAAALPRILSQGAPLDLVDRAVAETVAGNLLAAALLGVLGVSLGALVRNQTVALVFVAAWALVGEGVLSIVAGREAARWLPGGAAQAVISGGDGLLPLGAAAVLLAGYAALGALAASRLTVSRDIA